MHAYIMKASIIISLLNIMVLISVGSIDHVAHVWRKIGLQQIKLPKFLHTRAPISKVTSNKSSMDPGSSKLGWPEPVLSGYKKQM